MFIAHCPFSSGQIALQVAHRKNTPIVATFHSKYYEDFKEALRLDNLARLFVRKIITFYNSVDTVWTVNRATIDTLREYGFKGNVDVVPNGTDLEPVHDRRETGDLARKMLNVQDNRQILLFVGQHIWQKNIKMLVQALCRLKTLNVRFHMVFVGKGYAEKDIKSMCNEMGLRGEVTFLGQIMERNILRSLYSAAAMLLLPSLYDNAPLVVREAAAAGCPALLIRGSNSAEGIEDGYNGFLSGNNPDIYAYSIRDILSVPGKCETVGINARKTLYRNWEQIVDEVAYRYTELIKEHRQKTNPKNISRL